jgi:hypothetical protein
MTITLFGIVIVTIVTTGAILVLGGLFLIGSGALKLVGDQAGKTDLKVGDILQVGTTVPGLGIFLLGLAFSCVSLYYANQARQDDVKEQVKTALEKIQNDHALRLTGLVQMKADQDVRLSICMGQKLIVRSNNPFVSQIGPYLDFIVVSMETEGAAPKLFTITDSHNLSPSFKSFSRIVQPRNGLADIGQVVLDQVVNLTPAIASKALPVASVIPIPAGQAYQDAHP